MSHTKEDYFYAVLAGKCDYQIPTQYGFETKTTSYQAWAASQKMKQDMRDYLAKRLGKKCGT